VLRSDPGGEDMNHLIIKIESGVVAAVYSTASVNVTVVDHDVIEGGETYEARMKKAVLSMIPEPRVSPEDMEQLVETLVLECQRPADRRRPELLIIGAEKAA